MKKQVTTISRSCFALQINHNRKYLTTDATKYVVNSRETSRLDYSNALLIGVPKVVPKQVIKRPNTAARPVEHLAIHKSHQF